MDVLLADGTFETWYKDQMNFSYRHSAIQDQPAIVLSATFKLTPGDYDQIEKRMKELTELRELKAAAGVPFMWKCLQTPSRSFHWKINSGCRLAGISLGRRANL